MDLYSLILQNKETLKLIYALIIVVICFLIVLKTNKLFKISLHNGIRYFRNAFFFYGLGFTIRYLLWFLFDLDGLPAYSSFATLLFEFFLVMGGFFLLYSLIWKKFESYKSPEPRSSLFNPRILILYSFTIILVIIDFLWGFYHAMFFSQIMIFILASAISYANFIEDKGKHKFPKFYFVAMLASLIAWIMNTLADIYLGWDKIVMINVYVLNMVVFLLFLYGVIKSTR